MTVIFEQLFYAWCGPYDPQKLPPSKGADPATSYGQYAFEEGFKLAAALMFLSLDHRDLSEME